LRVRLCRSRTGFSRGVILRSPQSEHCAFAGAGHNLDVGGVPASRRFGARDGERTVIVAATARSRHEAVD